eukprot:symbB.v1.2.000406.t1/scaffold30.1/size407774/22
MQDPISAPGGAIEKLFKPWCGSRHFIDSREAVETITTGSDALLWPWEIQPRKPPLLGNVGKMPYFTEYANN